MKKVSTLTLCLLILNLAWAQKANIQYMAEVQTSFTDSKHIPFWLRSNTFGSTPIQGISGSMIVNAQKEYIGSKSIDWGAGFEARGNGGKKANASLIEGYAKLKLGIFQIKAGRTKDVMGYNGDSSLTLGNFSVSGNALGIPKVEVAIPEYYTLPILNGLIAIKGTLSHGWIGRIRVIDSLKGPNANDKTIPIYNNHPLTYFHQKSLYGRLGRADWRLKIYGGINHQAFWGSEQSIYGENFELSPLQTFYYVSVGKTYSNTDIPSSKIGNQLGSIDLGLEYSFNHYKLSIYRQSFYDVGALSKLANIADGLNGVSITNQKKTDSPIAWTKFLIEFFYSKNQAGLASSRATKSGDEDYYNNFFYQQGWSYKGSGLGSPIITPAYQARSGQASSPTQYFINNRIAALHAASSGRFFGYKYLIKLTYSKNYGTFSTSSVGTSTGGLHFEPMHGIFKEVGQFSAYLDASKTLKDGISAGLVMALDKGNLLYNSSALSFRISKTFN